MMLSTCFGLIPPRSLLALFRLYQIRVTNTVCVTTNTYSFMMAMFYSCKEKCYALLVVCNVMPVWRRRLWYRFVILYNIVALIACFEFQNTVIQVIWSSGMWQCIPWLMVTPDPKFSSIFREITIKLLDLSG
jgi:hypothetical protein